MHKMLAVKKKWREKATGVMMSGILIPNDPRSTAQKRDFLHQQDRYSVEEDDLCF
jgi:hypothetical protein